VSSKGEREREGGDEGDVGDSNKARIAATCARARKTGGRVSSKSERERKGGDEGDVGVTNEARWGRKMKAKATHPDERGQACVHGKRSPRRCLGARVLSLGKGEPRPIEYEGQNV
jgi:hypothetical protein